MTYDETGKILTIIAIEFPKEINLADTEKFEAKLQLWFKALEPFPYALISTAAEQCLMRMHFCPKLADIFERVEAAFDALLPSPAELWATVYGMITRLLEGNIGGYSGFCAAWDEFLPEVKEYFANDSQIFASLRELDTHELQFEKSRFLKAIPEIRARLKTRRSFPENLVVGSMPAITEGE